MDNKSEGEVTRTQQVWLKRLSQEEKAHERMRKRAREVEGIFRNDIPDETVFVPLYWSVVGVEHVGVYSNQPVPDVRPRNESNNPVYKSVARVVQRGLAYCTDHPSFDESMHRSVDDYLAMGLGTSRIKVDSVINSATQRVPIYGVDPMGNPLQVGSREETTETITDQAIRWEYVPWSRIGWEPCNNWKYCSWMYIRHRMTQLQIKKRFGRVVSASKDENDRADINNWKSKTFDIYEIWDKNKKEVLFIAKGEAEPLEINPDPLNLVGFYPIPQPMMTNLPSEELIPCPDYNYIETYDLELNRLQERKMSLTEQIKASGAYDQGFPELADILEQEDGEMLPIQNLMQRLNAAGGMDNAMWFSNIMEKVQALQVVTEQIAITKAQVDEILGISDIVRGVTAASETATAQEIKGRWVGVRLTRKRECVIYTVKEMMRMMAQLLASHITPENLQRMTQMEITDEMMQILTDDMLMEFLIDIETESTVAKDEFRERETHQEMLNGVAQFAQSVLPMVQQNSLSADTASAILQSALRPYSRYDRNLDEALTQMPTTQQQLQGLNQQLQELDQQFQQAQQGMQYWQQVATQLQQQATEAKIQDLLAKAQLNKAKGAEVVAGLTDAKIQDIKTVSEIALNEANAGLMNRTEPRNGQYNGQ